MGTDTHARDAISANNQVKNYDKDKQTDYFNNTVVVKSSLKARLADNIRFLIPVLGFIIFTLIIIILLVVYMKVYYKPY
jgi:ABC-type transport system involved in cytochrome c biogenesis permease subunit